MVRAPRSGWKNFRDQSSGASDSKNSTVREWIPSSIRSDGSISPDLPSGSSAHKFSSERPGWWARFGQRELGPDIPVQMRVRDVMHHLPDGPSAVAVRCVELCVRKIRGGSPQLRRRFGNLQKIERALLRREWLAELKRTDWISEVVSGHWSHCSKELFLMMRSVPVLQRPAQC